MRAEGPTPIAGRLALAIGMIVTLSLLVPVGGAAWSTAGHSTPATARLAVPASTYLVTFAESGLPGGTPWYLNVSGQPSVVSTATTAPTRLSNGTYNYTVATPQKSYRPSPASGRFSIEGAALSQTVAFSSVTYVVKFTETGLPAGTRWYLNVTGETSVVSTATTSSIGLANNTYTFTVATVNTLYQPSPASGNFTVAGAALSETVGFSLITYKVTVTESGLPTGTRWYLNVTGHSSVASTTTAASIALANGTYRYTVAAADKIYGPFPASGTLLVAGAPLSRNVTFSKVTYAVTFTESGLPAGTRWYLNVTGQSSVSSTTTTASILLANGTYHASVATSNKIYGPSPASSTFDVAGRTASETAKFAPVLYAVTFRESGLPSGSSWSAILNGTAESSTGSPIAFTEVNGTYPYSVATSQPGWGSTEPYGTVAVLGVPVVVAETFVTLYVVTFTESTLPSGTNWTATASGTIAPVAGGSSTASQRYTVTQWSNGAASVVISLPNGTYAYSASAPGYSSSSGAILVTGRSPPVVSVLFVNQNPSSSSAVPAWVYEVTAVLIVVVIVGVVLAVRRRPPPVVKRAPPPARPPNRAR